MSYTSKIPQILAAAARDIHAANRRSAERIAEDARAKVPTDDRAFVRESIRVVDTPEGTAVLAGGKGTGREGRGFYAHMLEFGSARNAARPFLVPAAEAEREAHERAVREAYQ